MASGVRIVSVPRRVTKKNEERKLDGYHYVGMEDALRKYTHPRFADQCCWVYMQRDPKNQNSIVPDPLSIVGKVINYDDEQFTIELSRTEWYDALPKPEISIACTGYRDVENKTINVKTITGLYLGSISI